MHCFTVTLTILLSFVCVNHAEPQQFEIARGCKEERTIQIFGAESATFVFSKNVLKREDLKNLVNSLYYCQYSYNAFQTFPEGDGGTAISVHFRDGFLLQGPKRSLGEIEEPPEEEGCFPGPAVIIYEKADGRSYEFCSDKNRPRDLTFSTTNIIIEFSIDFSIRGLIPDPPTVGSGDGKTKVNTTVPDEIEGFQIIDYLPQTLFSIDVTTYRLGCEGIGKGEFLCASSRRCLSGSMVCDKFGAENCASARSPNDYSDQAATLCNPTTNTTTTTTRSTTNAPRFSDSQTNQTSTPDTTFNPITPTVGEVASSPDLVPVWTAIGIFLSGVVLASLYWIYILHVWPWMKEHLVLDRLEVFLVQLPPRLSAFAKRLPGLIATFIRSLPARMVHLARYISLQVNNLRNLVNKAQPKNDPETGEPTDNVTTSDRDNRIGEGTPIDTTVLPNSSEPLTKVSSDA